MKRVFFIILLLIGGKSFCSFPLMHVYVAEMFDNYFPQGDRGAFMIGTLFPDIRYMTGLERDETHEEGITILDILNANSSFEAGRKLHSFVDDKRAKFIKKTKIYEKIKLTSKDHLETFLKILEDEVLYGRGNRSYISCYLSDFSDEELAYASSFSIYKWHAVLQTYLNYQPSIMLRVYSWLGIDFFGISKDTIAIWSGEIAILRENENFQNYVDDLLNFFEKKFQKQAG